MSRARLKGMLIRHEGLELKPYRCTAGKLSIGVGRNLEDEGISKEEALYLLENNIAQFQSEAEKAFPWFSTLDEVRQDVILDMLFMGMPKFLEFRKMISAMERKRYELAAIEMLDSDWAIQVGRRATELAKMMKEGRYP